LGDVDEYKDKIKKLFLSLLQYCDEDKIITTCIMLIEKVRGNWDEIDKDREFHLKI